MAAGHDEPREFPDLPDEAWLAVQTRVRAFEEAWAAGPRPRVADYLSPDDPSGGQLLVELVNADLEFRLKAGDPVRVEEYLAAYPALTNRPGVVAGLLAAEYRLRRRREPDTKAAEYGRRFPDLIGVVTALVAADDTAEDFGVAPPEGPDALPLPTVPGYELLEEIGRGGMGVVYKAVETRLKRAVALKTVRPGGGPRERKRLRKEAEAAAALTHPNVVPVYSVFECDSRLFVASEYLPGGTLAKKTHGGLATPHEAASLVEAISRAVAAAHAAGILHRDLKPSNVLLAADGTPKVGDFGLAKREGDDSDVTRTGVIAGSPCYMAPEQAGGDLKIGPAADVWALGAILYELLTGRPPFRGTTVLDTLEQVRRDEPVAPRRLVPKLPRDLETVCLKCLEKDPAKRYPSAAALGDDLGRFHRGEPMLARPPGPLRRAAGWADRHRSAAVLLVTLTAGLAAGAAGLAVHTSELERLNVRLEEEVVKAERSVGTTRRLLFASDMRQAADAVREGDLVRAAELLDAHRGEAAGEFAFVWNHLDRLVHAPGGKIDHLGGPAYFACFSPGGDILAACGEKGEVRLYEVGTWKPLGRWNARQGELNGLAFSPDGTRLVSAGDDGAVVVWDLATRTEVWRTKVFGDIAYQVAFGLGGTTLAVCGRAKEIVLCDPTTGVETTRLEADDDSVESIAVTPDGKTLVAATRRSGAAAWDLETAARLWKLREIEAGDSRHNYMSAAVSPDGRLAAFGRRAPSFLVVEISTGRVLYDGPIPTRTAVGDGSWCRTVSFLADSRTLAVSTDAGVVSLVTLGSKRGATLAAPRAAWLSRPDRTGWLTTAADGTIVTASREGSVDAWRPDQQAAWRGEDYPEGKLAAYVAAAGDGADGPRFARFKDVKGGGAAHITDAHRRTVELPGQDREVWYSLIASADGRRLFASQGVRELIGWETGVDPPALLFRRDVAGVSGPYVESATGDGRRGVAHVARGDASDVHELFVFDGSTGETVALRQFPSQAGRRSVIAENGSVVGVADDTRLLLLDPKTLETRFGLEGHGEKIVALALSPDGRFAATAGNDREVIVWNTSSGRRIRRWQAGPGIIVSVIFSRGGGLLLTATEGQPPRLWDIDTTRLLLEPGAAFAPPSFRGWAPAAFTPDGNRIVVGRGETVLVVDGRPAAGRAGLLPAP